MRKGRPSKSEEEKRSETIGIRFTKREADALYLKAGRENTEVSPMIRCILNDLGILVTPKTRRLSTRII
ncbi:hypothetical protein LCGC14_2126630 [marine sediment metagenome]|uniref:Uncharacterized protein n=1 Tax=marine sediment metagenome TaxID=412755 RepID=A0A0F9GYY6_9ZZZZ